jgi:hypothetical protein
LFKLSFGKAGAGPPLRWQSAAAPTPADAFANCSSERHPPIACSPPRCADIGAPAFAWLPAPVAGIARRTIEGFPIPTPRPAHLPDRRSPMPGPRIPDRASVTDPNSLCTASKLGWIISHGDARFVCRPPHRTRQKAVRADEISGSGETRGRRSLFIER